MIIPVNSHDVLGKLTIIKNYLSVLSEDVTLSESQKKYLDPAFKSACDLIQDIKTITINSTSK